MIIAIKQEELHRWWPLVVQFIEKAMKRGYGEYDADDIHTLLEDGNAGLILSICNKKVTGGIVTTLIEKPALRELVVLTGGGEELDEWLDEISLVLDNIAREMQADVIALHGRQGWVKKLKSYGYEPAYTTVIKRV